MVIDIMGDSTRCGGREEEEREEEEQDMGRKNGKHVSPEQGPK